MDIDVIRQQFINTAERFLRKVEDHALGSDPARLHQVSRTVKNIIQQWENPLLVPLDELKRIDSTLTAIDYIMSFNASIDVSLLAIKMGVSDTSRGIMAQLQRDNLDYGSKFKSALSNAATKILQTRTLDIAQVEILLRSILANNDQKISIPYLGPIYSRIARRYVPLMNESTRREIYSLLMNKTAGHLLETTEVPINPKNLIYEQVLTSGQLVPITPSMSRNALFAIFNDEYNMDQTLQENLARLSKNSAILSKGKSESSKKSRFNIVFVSKVTRMAIEFDSRPLFDQAFIKRNNLEVPKQAGLNDKVLTRYTTTRVLSESGATVPNYFYYDANVNANANADAGADANADANADAGADANVDANAIAHKTLILESLVGNLFRIIGDAREQNGEGIDKYLVPNERCQFLVRGQSNRASQYHMRMENEIFKNGQTDEVRQIVSMYQTANTDLILADSLRNKMARQLKEYVIARYKVSSQRLSDVFAMAVAALQDIMPIIKSRSISSSTLSMFLARLFRLAGRIAALFEPYESKLIADNTDSAEKNRIVDKVMESTANEELFTMDETLNMMFLRRGQNPFTSMESPKSSNSIPPPAATNNP